MLRAGDTVDYFLSARRLALPLYTVLYEDDNILVVDKESGVSSEAVHAALCRGGELPVRLSDGSFYTPPALPVAFVHRLDRNTEGLLLFGKNEAVGEELKEAFRTRTVEKVYLALVSGVMPARHEVLRACLQKDEAAALVTVTKTHGEPIVTEYEVLEERGEVSLLKITLHTGKTHQIRAHLAYIGHPVVGDMKYGDKALNARLHATRQRLLAKEITLHAEGKLSYLKGRTFISPKML